MSIASLAADAARYLDQLNNLPGTPTALDRWGVSIHLDNLAAGLALAGLPSSGPRAQAVTLRAGDVAPATLNAWAAAWLIFSREMADADADTDGGAS